MGDGDAWPVPRQKIMDADILVFCTPTWVGHMSSVAQRVLYQALDDVGFTIPAQGGTYWNGEAMHTVDYKDLGAGTGRGRQRHRHAGPQRRASCPGSA